MPGELRAIVLKSLAKKVEERMASAEDFVWELTMLQDRFALTREETEGVWRVLLPLAHGAVPAQEPPGSTQDHLDLQFGLATTPAAGTLTSQATLRTEVDGAPLAEVVPFSPGPRAAAPSPGIQPTQLIAAPEDLDSTWASRPMRVRPVAEPETPPAPPPSRLRGAAAVSTPRRSRLWIAWSAVAGALLVLAALGVWLTRRPEKIRIAEPRPPAPKVLPASTVDLTPATPPQAEPTPVQPTPAPVIPKPTPTPRPKPVATEPASAPGPLKPMEAGDMIRRGQPNVEAPETTFLPPNPYPAAAKGTGRKVVIRVAVLVDENGQVIDAQIRDGDKSGLGFEETALEASRKTRFLPARRDGIAGKMWTELLWDFAE